MAISSVAVIGARATGQALAYAAALAGYQTILEDVSREMLEKGIANIRQALGEAVERGEIPTVHPESALARIIPIIGVEDAIRGADLVIEAVSEELEMKLELFTIFDKFAKPGAIFATTTRTLSILDISDVTLHRDSCIGMRFPSSAISGEFKRDCIELIPTEMTSHATLKACREVAGRFAKEVQLAADIPPRS
ncbi:MAG: 3-hydroxyacyl-CoA dehydrogenase NAD-binding domain-containing protein [Candidatus Acidiferrum sp.]|jgi:3-hydroxyacyl-CoA dehydrogenase